MCWVDEPGTKLADAHRDGWKPVLDYFNDDLGVELNKNESFIPEDQPQESIDKLGEYLRGLDDWEFTCVYVLSTAIKSLLLARSVLEGKVSIQEGKWWQGFLSERYAAPTDRQTD